MSLLALTTLEQIQQVPAHTWWMIALGVGAFLIVVLLVKMAGRINKFLLGAIVVLVMFVVGMEWVYNRDEPEWATPVVNWLASSGFLPTSGNPPPPKPGVKPVAPAH